MSGLWHEDVQARLAAMAERSAGGFRCSSLKPRPQASKFWSYGSPLLALAHHGADRRGPVHARWARTRSRACRCSSGSPSRRLRAGRADGQGHAAADDRAGAGGVLPLQRVEHRRRGPVHHRRDRRRRRGAAGRARTPARWIVPAILLAGVLGGMVWAGITALLRDRFNANEILVSLMLVYVADHGAELPGLRPVERPGAATTSRRRKTFEAVTQIPRLMSGFARQHRPAARAGRRGRRCGCSCFAPAPVLPSRWAAWRRRRRATPAFRRARRCGWRC